ncbi:MAG: bifunctional 2-C-methyl-D-erythritol 4-phosphate cytidylyltransferase/2-C-methyl-D-erythritol 2,4-cyclodiphosphate synthase [Rhodospirillaceae bacterium]|nr:bifunctional 2-C-methyl-D-erythritol 4-phosphate cytidylyltransferase/2-C-methyl-D-erythritol 2,4-cyclodiphosphate synthase [Rhodospirillaceae bacterium]
MAACYVLIVAAGSGERFGPGLPKQYRTLGGIPILRRSIRAFLDHPGIAGIQVVINPAHRPHYDAAVGGLALPPPVAGGATRQQTTLNGLLALQASAPDLVLIHDAVRPLVDAATITRVIDALGRHRGAVAAVPVVDTLKRAADGLVVGTVDRADLWHAQTPQGFRYADILAAHRAGAAAGLTDDAAVAEQAGIAVAVVLGHADNLKITTEADLDRAERMLGGSRPSPARPALPDLRVGNGFDVHRFGPGDQVTLCGVSIPHDAGLLGHSDADVGLHALTDAILGAIGDGDIGQHFPPTDPRWRGADSTVFLAHAASLVAARGGHIAHVDVTLICERPKIGPHRLRMKARLAELLALPADRVSVKATTTEGLGFTGRREGIAAQATATIGL